MQPNKTNWTALVLLGLVMLLWAGNSIVGRAVRYDIPPFALAFGRWALALMILLPFAIGPLRQDRAVLLRHWKIVMALGAIGVAGFNSFLYAGLRHTTATNALLLQAAIPALVVLFDRLLFGVRCGWWQAMAVGISVMGVMAIVFHGDPAAVLQLHFGQGDALILGGVVVWALYTVLLRLRPVVSPISLVAATFTIGAVLTAPLAFAEWLGGAHVVWSGKALAAFGYVAVFPSLVAYSIYNWAAAKVGAAQAGQAIALMPLFGAALSALLLGEVLLVYHYAGMALILFGIVLGALGPRTADDPRPAANSQDTAGARPGASLEDGA